MWQEHHKYPPWPYRRWFRERNWNSILTSHHLFWTSPLSSLPSLVWGSGWLDKAPRPSISDVIWTLSSATLFVSSTNYFQIVRRQCCHLQTNNHENVENPPKWQNIAEKSKTSPHWKHFWWQMVTTKTKFSIWRSFPLPKCFCLSFTLSRIITSKLCSKSDQGGQRGFRA